MDYPDLTLAVAILWTWISGLITGWFLRDIFKRILRKKVRE